MNNIKKQLFCTVLLLTTFVWGYARPSFFPQTDSLPRVFLLGETKDRDFEQLKSAYSLSLLEASQGDMETAYYTWMHMMKHLESYAKQQSYDLDGLKMWIYVFWHKDGSIAHLAYFLKPTSRNIREDDLPKLTQLFEGFCKVYRFPVKTDKGFSNYSHANFPILLERLPNANKQ